MSNVGLAAYAVKYANIQNVVFILMAEMRQARHLVATIAASISHAIIAATMWRNGGMEVEELGWDWGEEVAEVG